MRSRISPLPVSQSRERGVGIDPECAAAPAKLTVRRTEGSTGFPSLLVPDSRGILYLVEGAFGHALRDVLAKAPQFGEVLTQDVHTRAELRELLRRVSYRIVNIREQRAEFGIMHRSTLGEQNPNESVHETVAVARESCRRARATFARAIETLARSHQIVDQLTLPLHDEKQHN